MTGPGYHHYEFERHPALADVCQEIGVFGLSMDNWSRLLREIDNALRAERRRAVDEIACGGG